MDKIKQKDTMIQQNKQSLRVLDNKFKQLQQEVVGLNKLNKNQNDLFKKFKDIFAQIEDNQNQNLEKQQKYDYYIEENDLGKIVM